MEIKKEILVSISASVIAVIVATFVGFMSNSLTHQVKSEINQQIDRTQSDVADIRDDLLKTRDRALMMAEVLNEKAKEIEVLHSRVKSEVANVIDNSKKANESVRLLSQRVNTLTTDEISSKLSLVENGISTLSGKLDALQTIIDPKKATEILNVAKMQEEILARENLEKELRREIEEKNKEISDKISQSSASISGVESRISNTEKELRNLLYWILGLFVSLIAGLIALFGYFGKKFTDSLKFGIHPPVEPIISQQEHPADAPKARAADA